MALEGSEQQEEPQLRFAEPRDASEIARLLNEHATFDNQSAAATATSEELAEQMRSPHPPFECILAEIGEKKVGLALFFQNYSTWQRKPAMWLEDLYVEPEQRGHGIGKKLMQRLAGICRERGYGRMEWEVLSTNQPAIDFYTSINAEPLLDRRKFRISGDGLQNL